LFTKAVLIKRNGEAFETFISLKDFSGIQVIKQKFIVVNHER